MLLKTLKLLLILNLAFLSIALTANAEFYDKNDYAHQVTFKQGSIFRVLLQHKISTEFNKVDDTVDFILPSDMYIGEVLVFPEATKFFGKIVKLEKEKPGRNAFYEIIIDAVKHPDYDNPIDINAHIWTKSGDGTIGGEEVKERKDVKKVIHRIQGIGSVVQVIPYGEKVMGKRTESLPGEQFIIVLDKELNIGLIDNER